jgi:hypothetical protein
MTVSVSSLPGRPSHLFSKDTHHLTLMKCILNHNCGGFGQNPQRILNLKALEALLYGMLVFKPGVTIFQTPPRLVSELFGLSAGSYQQKKTKAKKKIKEKFDSGEIQHTAEQLNFYLRHLKKDDLADPCSLPWQSINGGRTV